MGWPVSFWYSDPASDRPQSIATGEAPLSEILTAAREQMRLVENSTAAGEALTRAYDQRIRDIEAATGETTQNPMRVDLQTSAFEQKRNPTYSFETGNETREAKIAGAVDGFNAWLADVAQRHPDKAAAIGADRPVERDAEALSRTADERLAKAMASRGGIGKWAAMLAGGVAGSGYDPLQVASMFAGGGPGAARTIGGRILAVTAKEAAFNAIAEAVQQPQVQAWRKQVGLPNGFDEAAKNVAFAGLLGGLLGGAGQGVAEGIGRLARGVPAVEPDAAARAIADAPDTSPALKAAIDGDARAAADLLRPIRDTLPAEARGAIDAADAARILDDVRPPAASPRLHDDAAAAALRAVQLSETFFHEPDPAQVSRIVDQLVPETAAAKPTGQTGAEPGLAEFLMRAGGVQEFRGELDAIGATKVRQRFVGSLVREDGMPLDQARLRAAEAGYFNHLYGTPDEAAAKSTIADLLDALDTGAREDVRIRTTDDGGRAYAETLVHEIAARAGPAVDDRLILQAAELANAERIAPAEALDRVLIADDLAKEAGAATEAAGINPADTRGGLDDPLGFSDEDAFSRADLEDLPEDMDIPFFDDEAPISRDALIEHLDNLDHLTAVVEACRA